MEHRRARRGTSKAAGDIRALDDSVGKSEQISNQAGSIGCESVAGDIQYQRNASAPVLHALAHHTGVADIGAEHR